MKKFIAGICLVLFGGATAFAQAYATRAGKGKAEQAAVGIRLPLTSDQVEDAVKAFLSQKGYGSSRAHGYILSRGVPLSEEDKEGSDLYFMTSTPDRKVKDNTELLLIPVKKNQDIGSGVFVDSSRLDQARAFLDGLAPYVTTHGINAQAGLQQEALLKAQKKMTDLRNDSTDLEKRLRNLQSDLARNKSDQVQAASDLQTYVGADSDKKYKYQKRVNSLMDKQGSLEKKIRNTSSDLDEKKSDMVKQQQVVDQMQQSLDAIKQRQS